MKENNNTPEIRFDSFTDDWEQRKLGEFGQTYSGLSGKTKEDFGHGNAKFIPYLNIFNNPITDLNFLDKIEIDKNQHMVRYGDILFTTSSETPEEVGMSSVWLGKQGNIYLNSFCFGFTPTYKLDEFFIAYLMRSPNFRKNVILLAQGISRYNISKNKMMMTKLYYPAYKEQILIGRYFKSLDNLITLHQRELEKNIHIKDTMLEKMFPIDDTSKPEIRFNPFTDDWNSIEFGKIFSKIGKNSFSRDLLNYQIGDVKNIHYGDILIKFGFHIDVDDKVVPYINKEVNLSNYSKDDYLQSGDVIFADTAEDTTAGKMVEIINDNNMKVLSGLHTYACRPTIEFEFGFLGIALNSPNFHDQLLPYMQGTKVTGFNYDSLTKTIVKFPCLEEQKMITNYFKELDVLINNEENAINKLKEIKKTLLEKMFV